jgi:hypothetical protein
MTSHMEIAPIFRPEFLRNLLELLGELETRISCGKMG